MKKVFLLAAAICAAVGINAAVIELDLSKASQYATAGSATLNYANGELTVNWTVTEAWEVSGIEIPLKSVKGIVGIQYEYAGDGSEHSFLHYLRDLQGYFWWDPNGWFNLQSTTWQSASVTPSTALWSTPGYEYGLSPMLALCFVANPETPTSGSFKLRNVKIITSGEGGNDSIPDGQSLPLTYNGEILPINTEFERSMTGTLSESLLLPEISGIACSRVTPGYIWMQGDETDRDTNPFIIATDETGSKLAAKVSFNKVYRWDWEDMCGGVYNDTNYLFIGGFGDNNHTDGEYCIIYFKEPAINPQSPEVSVTASRIKFAYPDGQKHNCEALMYDNIEQKLYIITKVYYDVCQVFSLPFSLNYGETQQTLTYVCDLGVTSDIGMNEMNQRCRGFHLVTAADITPDGKYILIKNHNNIEAIYSWTLYWERTGNESISETLKRQPQVIDCYQYEWQGEAICWLDNNTFYTTSDSDGEPPIYKYTRQNSQGFFPVNGSDAKQREMVCIDNVLYVRSAEGLYTLDGRKVKF